jgi:penicillin amidase
LSRRILVQRLQVLLALVLVVGILAVGERPVASLPPLRPLFDPWNGAWQVAESARELATGSAPIPGLEDVVQIEVDSRGVPHVFAISEVDVWRAQGWLVARDRLFQLNLQTRATAGRLSEWVGPRALEADRRSRRLGLARAAEQLWAALPANDPSRLAMMAYAEGVNAWIASLHTADLPLEYRLLGVRPDAWEPQHSFYLFQQMATVLAAMDVTEWRARAAALVGWEAAEALLPLHSPLQEPIQPNGQFAFRTDPLRLPPPGVPDSTAGLIVAWLDQAGTSASGGRDPAGEAVGSNNWAVASTRTAAGRALLAGDPHLNLTLPSIWYEVHLVVPGLLDVAGAALPGAPGVVIGFNRALAWSVTNTGADVLDFYQESVDDPVAPARYQLDGEWLPLESEEAVYRDQRGRVLHTDTLRFNHRGPVILVGDRWTSSRWTMREAVEDPHVWLGLNRAASVDEGLDATARYVGPAQNFVLADTAGRIAIRSTGFYPVRPGNGRGDGLRDGATRTSDWTGWLPLERYPGAHGPAQGFLASANQEPIDPRASADYLGADWPAPWRAIRINALLRADSAVTPEAMRRFQTDPGSAAAEYFIPQLLGAAARVLARDTLRTDLALASSLLAEWDRRYDLTSRRAVLFEQVLQALGRLAWDELIAEGDSVPVIQPGQDLLAALMAEPASPWWDDRRTAEVEDRDALLARALEAGLVRTLARYGEPGDPRWIWSGIRRMNIHHLLRLGPLSRTDIPVPSGTGTLSPSAGGGTHGASWRMVVEMGPEVRAWTTFPGGQSGNPLSRWYDDRLDAWTKGDLAVAHFPRAPGELREQQVSTRLSLQPGGSR